MKNAIRMFFLAVMTAFVAASCTKEAKVTLSETAISIAPEGGTKEIALTSNGDWTVSSTIDWLSVSPLSGNGDATLTVVALANASSESRSATIGVSTKDQHVTLVVTQDANSIFLEVSPAAIECNHEGGTFDVEVSTDQEWNVTDLPGWISCQPVSGTGSASLSLVVSEWESEARPRQATITIGSETLSATVSIKQMPKPSQMISVAPDRIEFEQAGGTQTLSVTCSGAWAVEADADWVVLSATSGQGDAEIQLTAPEHTEYVERVCVLFFESEYGTRTEAKIMQIGLPAPHFLNVTPMEQTMAGEGGSFVVAVECDTDWEAASSADWITLANAAGNGNGSFSVEVEANTLFTPRNAQLTVTSDNIVRRIVVQQEGTGQEAYVHVSPGTLSVPQYGGVATLEIAANVQWRLVGPNWITLLNPTGTADGSCGVAIDANNTYQVRTGFIKAYYGNELMEEVEVTQEGIPVTLQLDVTEINTTAAPSRHVVNVVANQGWTVQCEASWIIISREREDGKFLIVVTDNTTSSSREAVVKVVGRIEGERTISIHQAAN